MVNLFAQRTVRTTSLLLLTLGVLVACAGTLWKVSFGTSQYLATSSLVDDAGNTYVAGVLPDTLFLAKLNHSGEKIWEQNFDNTDGDEENIRGIDAPVLTQGPDGSLYLAYRARAEASGFSPLVLKYSSEGELMWSYRSNDLGWLTDIAIADDGQVYASGWYFGDGDGSLDSQTGLISLSSDGGLLWESADEEVFYADSRLQKNQNGSGVFIVASDLNEDSNWHLIHKDFAGNTLWRLQPFADYFHAFLLDINQDSEGNVYASGYVNNEGLSQWRLAVAKYDQLGNLLWRFVETTDIDVTSARLAYTIRTAFNAEDQLSILDFRGNVTHLSSIGVKLWREPVAEASSEWAMTSALAWGSDDRLYATVSTVDGPASNSEPMASLTSIYGTEGALVNSVLFPAEQLIQSTLVAKKTLVSVGNGGEGVVVTKLRVK